MGTAENIRGTAIDALATAVMDWFGWDFHEKYSVTQRSTQNADMYKSTGRASCNCPKVMSLFPKLFKNIVEIIF
jgi:hypothetical protein